MILVLIPCKRFVGSDNWSRRITVASAWFAFLLFSAYFSGAMTMFLTTEDSRPFQSVREGMRMWPEWKMVIHHGKCYKSKPQ